MVEIFFSPSYFFPGSPKQAGMVYFRQQEDDVERSTVMIDKALGLACVDLSATAITLAHGLPARRLQGAEGRVYLTYSYQVPGTKHQSSNIKLFFCRRLLLLCLFLVA